jgi:hypothetical protein
MQDITNSVLVVFYNYTLKVENNERMNILTASERSVTFIIGCEGRSMDTTEPESERRSPEKPWYRVHFSKKWKQLECPLGGDKVKTF